MVRLIMCGLCGCLLALVPLSIAAQDKQPPKGKEVAPEDPIHDELRALRAGVEKAVNGKDIDGLLKHVHANVVVVWQNGEISRGHKGVREYHKKVMEAPDAPL